MELHREGSAINGATSSSFPENSCFPVSVVLLLPLPLLQPLPHYPVLQLFPEVYSVFKVFVVAPHLLQHYQCYPTVSVVGLHALSWQP